MENKLLALATLGAGIGIAVNGLNKEPVVQQYHIKTDKVKSCIRIAIIADLHCTCYGEKQAVLAELIKKQKPDLAVFTGDTDDGRIGSEPAADAVKAVSKFLPTYLILGNHELKYRAEFTEAEMFRNAGARVLGPGKELFTTNSGDTICIYGLPDWSKIKGQKERFKRELSCLSENMDTRLFNILLSHRPELAELYFSYPYDAAISGHAHGGQWRLPNIVNGVYAPGQGFFPDYAGGIYRIGTGTLVVSRGLAMANTVIPRIFNPPELTVLDIIPR